MNRYFILTVGIALSAAAVAAPRTVVLSIPTMDCPVCPITVKKALDKVPGVNRTEVTFDQRRAIVTFEDARTGVEALLEATQAAGYPSKLADAVQ